MNAVLDGAAQMLLPTNLLALVALGLLAGQNGRRDPRIILVLFATGLVIGTILIALGLLEPPAAIALLMLAALMGLLVAIGRSLPVLATLTLTLVTGAALALNTPPQAITIPIAIVAQLGGAITALAVLGLVAFIASKAEDRWPHIGVRIAGSWIAASAILVLALRLAR